MAPGATLAAAGVTAMEIKVALVTVKVEVPAIAPLVAVITLLPTATALAKPVAAPTVAAAGVADVQATWVVRFLVVASE